MARNRKSKVRIHVAMCMDKRTSERSCASPRAHTLAHMKNYAHGGEKWSTIFHLVCARTAAAHTDARLSDTATKCQLHSEWALYIWILINHCDLAAQTFRIYRSCIYCDHCVVCVSVSLSNSQSYFSCMCKSTIANFSIRIKLVRNRLLFFRNFLWIEHEYYRSIDMFRPIKSIQYENAQVLEWF